MFSKYSAVHLHRSEAGQDHQLALAGEAHKTCHLLCFHCDHNEALFELALMTPCLCLCAAGGVCPTVDPHVLPVPCCPLLHHLVSPLSPLHRHHRRAAANSHHHGDQLDDYRRTASHI